MINLHAAQLLSLPTGAKSDVAPKLPWPNGSIITAQMSSSDSEGSVILSLGGYRLRAQVPPNTPLGNVWLLLINREMPAQFQLLHEAKAATMLADILAQKVVKDGPASAGQRLLKASEDGWYKMDLENLPFRPDISGSGDYVMLRDQEDDGARGMLNQKALSQGFLLHGRVDYAQLGAIAFALHGGGDVWKLRIYAGHDEAVMMLREHFEHWLQAQVEVARDHGFEGVIEGGVDDGLPDNFSFIPSLEG